MVTRRVTLDPAVSITALRHMPPIRSGLCAGRFDLPVAEPCERLSVLLAELRARHLRRICTSPSRRCSSLAATIAEQMSLTVHLDERLVELDFGEWEGRPWDEVARDDRERFEAWSADWQRAAPPRGESVADLEARIMAFLAALPCESVLVVTHAGPIRAMRVVLTGCSWHDAMAGSVQYCVPLALA